MRQTPQREGILQVLRDSDRPLTVEEIWERMPERRSGLPTVYRNLERFVREGWAESILGADQIMRFVRCESRHHHHHLQCEHCGRTLWPRRVTAAPGGAVGIQDHAPPAPAVRALCDLPIRKRPL